MPDSFTERPQENLLTALPWNRDQARLLWRSVAAVLAWTENLTPQQMKRLHGSRVAAVEVGNAEITATVLQLRKDEHDGCAYLVPVRDLPENHCFRSWHVRPFDLTTAETLLHEAGVFAEPGNIWQLCTGSSLLLGDAICSGTIEREKLLLSTSDGWEQVEIGVGKLAEARLQALSETTPHLPDSLTAHIEGAYRGPETGQEPHIVVLREVMNWIRGLEDAPSSVLLFGPVAEIRIEEDKALAWKMVEELYHMDPRREPPICPGRQLPLIGVVSRGCALYGMREQMGAPTYYEKLPRFSVVGRDQFGEQAERDLVTVPEGLVQGGKEYKQRLDNIALIRRAQKLVRFRLRREQDEKQLKQELPSAPLQECRLTFDVSLRAAQGYASVHIIPDPQDVFGGREMVLDWSRMEGYDGTDEAEGSPSFPPCASLPTSDRVRNNARDVIREYVRSVQRGRWEETQEPLKKLSAKMMAGKAYGAEPKGAEIITLEDALKQHFEEITRRRRPDKTMLKAVVKVAASLYKRTPDWAIDVIEKDFRRALRKDRHNPKPDRVYTYAAGRCFSTQEQVELFVNCMKRRFRNRTAHYRNTPSAKSLSMQHWCKALWLILSLNEEAVLWVDHATAEFFAESLQYQLCVELDRAGSRHNRRAGVSGPYKDAMLAILYLLRARATNASFLSDSNEPGSIAYKMNENLRETDRGRWRWVPRNRQIPENKSVQSALINYLESQATSTDLIIVKAGSEDRMDEGEV